MFRILSNPIELKTVAEIIARGEQPNLRNLLQEQYDAMANNYQEKKGSKFPLKRFAEDIYKMHLNEEFNIPAKKWSEELKCMESYKMVISRKLSNNEGGALRCALSVASRRVYTPYDRYILSEEIT